MWQNNRKPLRSILLNVVVLRTSAGLAMPAEVEGFSQGRSSNDGDGAFRD